MTVAPAVIGMGALLLRTSIAPFATLFDYYFGPGGLRVAKATIQRFVERASRLYEQERERPDCPSALGMYVRRWNGWVRGGLGVLCDVTTHQATTRPLSGQFQGLRAVTIRASMGI